MVGFVYAGTTCLSLLWTWFCVGETAGRTSLEISLFFAEKIPVRSWKTHVFPEESLYELKEAENDFGTETDGKAEHAELEGAM